MEVTGAEKKRFFISHAGPDKPFALELKENLDNDAWVDINEIRIGQVLVEEISAGIESATDFILLWSRYSAESRWVMYELNMAFIRWLQDSAISLRVVKLDDTPLPLTLRPFLYKGNVESARNVADALLLASGPPPSPRRRFFNRHMELGYVEEALYDPSVIGLFICGVAGVGKRTLAREALNRLTTGADAIRTIAVAPGTAEPELNLLVSGLMRVKPSPEDALFTEIVEHTSTMLSDFSKSGGIWVFEEAQHWLNDDGSLARIALQVLEALAAAESLTNRLAIFTSRRKPRFLGDFSAAKSFFLQGLTPQFALPLLRAHDATGRDDELLAIAVELDGHPLALEVVSPQLPLDAKALQNMRYEIATDLIDPIIVLPSAWRLLELLALADGPVLAEDLAANLDLEAEEFQAAINQSVELSLLSLDSTGLLVLHPLLRDYFLRSFRKQPDHHEKTARLAETLNQRMIDLQESDPLYIPSLLAAVKVLGLAGRFEDALSLRHGLIGTMYETANELYQERRYAEALRYIEEALTGDSDIDVNVLRLKAKTLAYLGRFPEARSIGDELVKSHPHSAAVLRDRGRVEFIARNWSDSINYFFRAIPLRSNPSPIWVDIAQAQIRMEDWAAAAVSAKTAIDRGNDTPWALVIYAQALEEQGLYVDAEDVMTQAVRREPKNSAYRHRLGRIALRTGNLDKAIDQFRESVELDPDAVQSWLSLASALADAGRLEEAAPALDTGAALAGAPAAVVENVRAKILLLNGEVVEAQEAIEKALRGDRDVKNLALAIRITIALSEGGFRPPGQAQAQVTALARELDGLGALQMIYDLSVEHPTYFGSSGSR